MTGVVTTGGWTAILSLILLVVSQNAYAGSVAKGWEPMKKAVDAFFEPTTKPHSTGGALILMHGGERVFSGTYGAANREWDIPWQTDTQFWTASVAKSYAAQIVLHLAEDGLIDLDAPVRRYIPEFPAYDTPVLVWHLLAMRSGLNDDSESQHVSGNGLGGYGGPGMTKEEILNFIYSQPKPIFTPGRAKAHYENVTYSVIDHLIETVTGLHFTDALKKYVTGPWSLKATGAYRWNHFWALGDEAATAYISAEGQDIPNIETEMPYTFLHANGIMYTTPDDFMDWVKHSAYGVNGEKSMFELMIDAAQLKNQTDSNYRFGIYKMKHRGYDAFGHGGYVGNQYIWVPELDIIAIVMTNEVGRYSPLGALGTALDAAMSILNIEPANDLEADRPLPGFPTKHEIRKSQKAVLADLEGIFLSETGGHVFASRRSNDGVILHSLDGKSFALHAQDYKNPVLTAYSGSASASRLEARFEQDTVTIKGWGHENKVDFKRVDQQSADDATKRAIVGLFYNEPWGSKFEIIKESDGTLVLWNGDRSAVGKRPLIHIAGNQWIAGSLKEGKFWSVQFDQSTGGALNSFTLHTPSVRNVKFVRLAPAKN